MSPPRAAPAVIRTLLAAAGLVALGACNIVLTEAPLFSAADAAGAPALRPGVWEFFKGSGCQVDERRPFDEWPDCAGGGLVVADNLAGPKSGAPKGTLERSPYVLAAGDPRIAQLQVNIDTSAGASAEASGDAQVETHSASAQAKPWGYVGVRPTRFDSEGRIVALVAWPVLCGPPPPKDAKGEDVALGTLHPFEGMEMKPGEPFCTTGSVEALRAAAKASEAYADKPMHESHWLRDGER